MPALPRSSVDDLAWRAATLDERLALVAREAGGRPPPDKSVLAVWARAFAAGDDRALGRRLAWDGVDECAARLALADSSPESGPPVSWAVWLPSFLEQSRAFAAAVGTPEWQGELDRVAPDPEPPFIEAWIPLVRAARSELAARSGRWTASVSAETSRALERHLIRQFAAVGQLALLEQFRKSRATYDEWTQGLLAGAWQVVFETYPVLARQLAMLAETWVETSVELMRRLTEDEQSIEATFGMPAGRIVGIVPGLSDRHDGGRSVAMVQFTSGLRLAYKPRDVRLEAACNGLLAWLRDDGLAVAPRPLRALVRPGYGWVEWADQWSASEEQSVLRYFRQAGCLACLVHLLGGADLHGENLVASSDGPVLIDTEMLLQPVGRAMAAGAAESNGDPPHELALSCLIPGLVSLIELDADGHPYDLGGLQPAPRRVAAVPRRRWEALRTEAVRFVDDRVVAPVLANDVRLDGAVQSPARFRGEILAGFEQTYRFLLSRRAAILSPDGPLAAFDRCTTRVIFRPSNQYGALQHILAVPRYQRRGVDRSLAIEMLGRVFCHSVERPLLWPLVADERRALESLDIPRLAMPTSSRSVTASNGAVVEGLFALSGCEAARLRFSSFSDEDLEFQLEQLRAALAPEVHPDGSRAEDGSGGSIERKGPGAEPVLITAAEAIGFAVLERAQEGPGGRLTWPACRGRLDLYGGASGILLFFSALASLRPAGPWREAALAALTEIAVSVAVRSCEGQPRVGGCSGASSLVYALTLAGRLLGDQAAVDVGRTVAGALRPGELDEDGVLDVEGGVAGALLAFIAASRSGWEPLLLDLSRRCVQRLLEAQLRDGENRGAWPAGRDGRPRPGFAHGAAGIAFALARWHEHDRQPAIIDAIHSAWSYERRVFRESGGVWPTTAADGSRLVMAAWCHGAPGIGLARACGSRYLTDDEVRPEIQSAMQATQAAPRARLDHVCCGNLARAEAILTVGRALGDAALAARGVESAQRVANQILEHGRPGMRGRGFERGAASPAFFQGLSGIGYQLLRSWAPERVPSVLAFEAAGRRDR